MIFSVDTMTSPYGDIIVELNWTDLSQWPLKRFSFSFVLCHIIVMMLMMVMWSVSVCLCLLSITRTNVQQCSQCIQLKKLCTLIDYKIKVCPLSRVQKTIFNWDWIQLITQTTNTRTHKRPSNNIEIVGDTGVHKLPLVRLGCINQMVYLIMMIIS